MTMGTEFLALFIGGLLALSPMLFAKIPSSWPWLDILTAQPKMKTIKFNRLEFFLPDSLGSCEQDKKRMLCTIKGTSEPLELTFELVAINGTSSLPLVRLLRKNTWNKSYGTVNHYEESLVDTGLGKLFLQSGIIYRLDNIQWPVLLRAFDVVIDDKTCISISTKCSRYDWPIIEKDIAQVLSSLKMLASK